METIYQIKGGIQRAVKTAQEQGIVRIERKLSDLPAQTKCAGQLHYTDLAWCTDKESLLRAVKEYTPVNIEFDVEIEEVESEDIEQDNIAEVDRLNDFFTTRPAIAKSAIAREAGISLSQLNYVLERKRTLTDAVLIRLRDVLSRYGY